MARRRILLGLNQYTHSAACCLLDLDRPASADPLFALSKERVTRKKHDGGDTAELVEFALEACGLRREDLVQVVADNHLFRIAPMEQTVRWATALHQYRPGYVHDLNLLPGVPKHELSHHLAHAWSVLPVAPFDAGLIVVMDGMGSCLRDVEAPDPSYTTDRSLQAAVGSYETPREREPHRGYREGESAYLFEGLELRPVWKRWIRENSPDFLYNYGFENMESLGAVYSRVASHAFGDWNACGKVMGLAPWSARWNPEDPGPRNGPQSWVLRGPLDGLRVNWERLRAEPAPNEWSEGRNRPGYARLAADLQRDLEETAIAFLRGLRESTGARDLALAGGVALNCVLNGRIARECGFDRVFVPSYPGDEGVAVGCALFGRHALNGAGEAPRRRPLPAALGRAYGVQAIDQALAEHASWVRAEVVDDPAETAAEALAHGELVAWFQGRSEFGPRALGQRSILAHPGARATIDRLNQEVKKREAFRPFAPSVLAERVPAWFAEDTPSPFMSFSVPAREELPAPIEAVLHVDRSARYQTAGDEAPAPFRRLLEAFERRTGIPMVLNTSFNVAGEPIVENPPQAIRSFLDGGIELLLLEDRAVRALPWPEEAELQARVPLHDRTTTVDMTSDADGEPLRVLMMHGGRTLESDPLAVGVLEHCDGERTVGELLALFAEEWEEEPEEVLGRLRRLWRQRLVGWT